MIGDARILHRFLFVVASLCLLALALTAGAEEPKAPLTPAIQGDWWTIAENPDLGELTNKGQEPVDFAVWQAADGTWQLWSCVRKTKTPNKTRLFYRWEGATLTDSPWKPMGIAMRADDSVGETIGGLQAPFVFKDAGKYVMVYGDWVNICSAESEDGKTFTRRLNPAGKSSLFSNGPSAINTRDPMVLRIGAWWYCFYTAHPEGKGEDYCRVSLDLKKWGKSRRIAAGGAAGTGGSSAECPFVVEPKPGHYFLFRTQRYFDRPLTRVYSSTDPLQFGVDEDAKYLLCELPVAAPEIFKVGDDYYIAALRPKLDGIRLARLTWKPRD